MKKIYLMVVLFVSLTMFATVAQARTYGWEPLLDSKGSQIGMQNVGEQGGFLTLSCDTKTHKLKMTYSMGSDVYDFFIFRKYGVIDVTGTDRAGKFYVGSDLTSQGDVYYNVMNADKAFAISRFEKGSKAKWELSVQSKSPTPPTLKQEGEETFLVGDDWKKLLKPLAVQCPVNFQPDQPIF